MARPPDNNTYALHGSAARLARDWPEHILEERNRGETHRLPGSSDAPTTLVPLWFGQLISAYVCCPNSLITLDLRAMVKLAESDPERQQLLTSLARFRTGAVETMAVVHGWEGSNE